MISRFVDSTFPNERVDAEGNFSTCSSFGFIDCNYTRASSIVIFCWTHSHPFPSTRYLGDVSVVDVNDAIQSNPIFPGMAWRSSPCNMDWRTEFITKRKG